MLFINQDLRMKTVEHRIIDSPRPTAPDAVHDRGERKSVVACSVRQGSVECATAEVITVRVKGLG